MMYVVKKYAFSRSEKRAEILAANESLACKGLLGVGIGSVRSQALRRAEASFSTGAEGYLVACIDDLMSSMSDESLSDTCRAALLWNFHILGPRDRELERRVYLSLLKDYTAKEKRIMFQAFKRLKWNEWEK